jgi:putative IMPACT (imprinted ancient) family translation regulator
MDYLNNVNNTTHSKFPTARNRILSYRVSQLDQISQREVMAEGFDDDGEDGAGEKLLHLLQKMEIENIVLIVCVWNNGV